MNRKINKKHLVTSLVFFIVSSLLLSSFSFKTKAAALDELYIYLSRIEANVAGTTEQLEIVLAINTTTTIPTGGTVKVYFPDGDDSGWCRTAGSLTVAAVTSSAADQTGTDWDIDSGLPTSGTLAAACAQGSGASSYDTITISNVGVVTAGTTYGVKLTNGSAAGVIGTDDVTGEHEVTVEVKNGTTVDSSTVKVYLITNDTVVVSATVSTAPSVNCSISTNTVALGTLYPGGSFSTGTHTITTSTSGSTEGYYWTAYGTGDGSSDAGLYYAGGPYLIASTGSATINLTTTEGFGITLSQPTGATVPADFSDASPGTVGALDRLPAGAQLILYQNGAQGTGENSTVTYGARAGASASAGAYTESVFFTCGGYY